MPKKTSIAGRELFIVDNSEDDWKALRYLHDWCDISKAIDVATGYFEIGSLLALEGQWQKVDKLRVLMGDEVSRRTKKAFDEGLAIISARLDASVESEKKKNEFLSGLLAIADGIRAVRIECRVYRKDKFHAKAYITHARMEVRCACVDHPRRRTALRAPRARAHAAVRAGAGALPGVHPAFWGPRSLAAQVRARGIRRVLALTRCG